MQAHLFQEHGVEKINVIARVALEGDPDDLVVLHDRTAGIAGVDGGVDLDDQVGIGAVQGEWRGCRRHFGITC